MKLKRSLTIGVLCLAGLCGGCAGRRQVKCRVVTFRGVLGQVQKPISPWHHGFSECEAGFTQLPNIQKALRDKIAIVIHGTDDQLEIFRLWVMSIPPEIIPQDAPDILPPPAITPSQPDDVVIGSRHFKTIDLQTELIY